MLSSEDIVLELTDKQVQLETIISEFQYVAYELYAQLYLYKSAFMYMWTVSDWSGILIPQYVKTVYGVSRRWKYWSCWYVCI